MSLANIQDSLVKTHLVSQLQSRGTELARTQEQAQVQHQRELAREADEVILSMKRSAEEEEIRDDEEREEDDPRRRKPPQREWAEEEEEAPPPVKMAEAIGPPPPPEVGSRKLDFLI